MCLDWHLRGCSQVSYGCFKKKSTTFKQACAMFKLQYLWYAWKQSRLVKEKIEKENKHWCFYRCENANVIFLLSRVALGVHCDGYLLIGGAL